MSLISTKLAALNVFLVFVAVSIITSVHAIESDHRLALIVFTVTYMQQDYRNYKTQTPVWLIMAHEKTSHSNCTTRVFKTSESSSTIELSKAHNIMDFDCIS